MKAPRPTTQRLEWLSRPGCWHDHHAFSPDPDTTAAEGWPALLTHLLERRDLTSDAAAWAGH
ncbi:MULTISPECIES: hypothetical protein [Frankia]|uniref:Uncharacterized protein n=1 Tax=Frankia alni (strain DSM 45986 / CECT 9034 / ACN14a) TaxID=326424 RepID=Q0RP20_FRAAA|nr:MULTISPECIES: hypothetical protein [Frankia]CAJ60715.1 hypothetical protein FRAAL2066 [Frankia alni ACN14a]